MEKDTVVIIPAAGQGKRMAAQKNKLFLTLGQQTILQHTVDLFLRHPRVLKVYLAIAEQDCEAMEQLFGSDERVHRVLGGAERQDSVANALQEAQHHAPVPQWVLVHDGARPLCPLSLITEVLAACEEKKAVIPVVPLVDTIRRITSQSSTLLNRAELFATQTPQGFAFDLVQQAYQQSKAEGWETTDDASVVEKYGHPVATVTGSRQNLKITEPDDLLLAEWWLTRQSSESALESADIF